MAHEQALESGVDDMWLMRPASRHGLGPAPALSPVPAGPGGGDPAAIYAALSHFTDEESSSHAPVQMLRDNHGASPVKLQPDGKASADEIKRMTHGAHNVGG